MSAEDRNGKVSTDEGCTTRERSFDELTKGLAGAAVSRRGALRLLATTLLGGALASVPGVGRIAGESGEAQAAICASEGQSCTAQKCCRGFTCLTDQTSGTEKFCCPSTDVCGQVCCPSGGICSTLGSGSCPCPTSKTRCTSIADPIGTCFNLGTDVNNCGACGNKCPGPSSTTQPCGMAACVAGQCAIIPDPAKTGEVCRQKAGPCDVQEVCSGASAECPPDVFLPATAECRAASTRCEGPALCPGNGPQCPEVNPLLAAGTVCREAAGQCDVQEVCTGASNQCPQDQFKLNGTACNNDNDLCTLETCQNGVCTSTGQQVQCPAPTDPCKVSVCVPATGICATQNAPNDTLCENEDICIAGGSCQNGTCQGGTAVTGCCRSASDCPTPTNPCQEATCTNNVCGVRNRPDTTSCDDLNPCTTGSTCLSGVCQGGAAVANCCRSASDCPTPTNPCQRATCSASNVCGVENKPDNSTCTLGCISGGSCTAGVCTATTTSTTTCSATSTNNFCCATGTNAGQCKRATGAGCNQNSQCCNSCSGTGSNRRCT